MEIEEQKNINKTMQPEDQAPQSKIDEIKRMVMLRKTQRKIPAQILNRRYKKLQQLIEEDDFFSEEAIKMRQPLLYYLYCGQYLKQQAENFSELSFAQFLEELMMKEEYRQQLEDEYNASKEKDLLPKRMIYDQTISEQEREDYEDELITFMHNQFLIGEEKDHFNYDEIDNDENLDDRKIIDQDQEDKYFDDEEENEVDPSKSEYTGIEDY
ncbi:coiled-coil protein, putative (macronuclear) [Tetrahymena thermophila SB210]|uniref:Coiled-coil protein, putative n=1 Tax=Tetrahymena thermophila (strain SB210) TaxID=312017 RepID=Q24CV1_TETTS|nr:coiled-coil protein, putative [Tetrahymena thermophila SB210]EAS05657.1 coiled-coil protein, putative [Tetrahymena thermophila SB210]|eukprot:XP_001025902.1 coiled-coil protein, putative [Tetrahymena thermophila SB210]